MDPLMSYQWEEHMDLLYIHYGATLGVFSCGGKIKLQTNNTAVAIADTVVLVYHVANPAIMMILLDQSVINSICHILITTWGGTKKSTSRECSAKATKSTLYQTEAHYTLK